MQLGSRAAAGSPERVFWGRGGLNPDTFNTGHEACVGGHVLPLYLIR